MKDKKELGQEERLALLKSILRKSQVDTGNNNAITWVEVKEASKIEVKGEYSLITKGKIYWTSEIKGKMLGTYWILKLYKEESGTIKLDLNPGRTQIIGDSMIGYSTGLLGALIPFNQEKRLLKNILKTVVGKERERKQKDLYKDPEKLLRRQKEAVRDFTSGEIKL